MTLQHTGPRPLAAPDTGTPALPWSRRYELRAGAGEWLWGVLLTGPAVFIVLTATTTAANAVIVDARHHMLTYIMMTHPHVAPSVLDPIAQRELGDAAVLLTGLLALVMMIFLLVFPPARALRYLSSLRPPPRLEPAPAGADWPDRQPWWPGPAQPGHDGGPEIISQGIPAVLSPRAPRVLSGSRGWGRP